MIRRHCEVSSQRTPKQLPQVWSSSTSFLFLLVLIYRYDYWYLQPIFSSLVDITVDWYHHLTTLRGGGWRRTGRCWLTQTQRSSRRLVCPDALRMVCPDALRMVFYLVKIVGQQGWGVKSYFGNAQHDGTTSTKLLPLLCFGAFLNCFIHVFMLFILMETVCA